jgi:hypothetical protein
MPRIDDHLCGLGIFWSGRFLGLSFTVCEWSTIGRNLEEPARGFVELGASDGVLAQLEGMATPTWTALSGDGRRFLRTRKKEESAERIRLFFCRFDVLMLVGLKFIEVEFKSAALPARSTALL